LCAIIDRAYSYSVAFGGMVEVEIAESSDSYSFRSLMPCTE
jgi:hypothetical protein